MATENPHRTAGIRLDAVLRALDRLLRHPDPAAISDGLSPPMARRCLSLAVGLIDRPGLERVLDLPGIPPRDVVVVAARGVFTAPLEWVAMLCALGSRVLVKAPAASPEFCAAMVDCFQAEGIPVSLTMSRQLPPVDAVLAMGSDSSMKAIASQHHQARLSLHGHRFSLVVIREQTMAVAEAIADDTTLYDGRGCYTPVAVVLLGSRREAEAMADKLAAALNRAGRLWPLGRMDPLLGPERRRRIGLARVRGRALLGRDWAVLSTPIRYMEPAALPRVLGVHAIAGLEQLEDELAPWARQLAACATDLSDPARLLEMGFERICRPGHLQRPPFGRNHGLREPLRPLMGFPSLELEGP